MIIQSYQIDQITLFPALPKPIDLDLMILEPVLNDSGVLQKLLPNVENIKSKSFYQKPDISETKSPF